MSWPSRIVRHAHEGLGSLTFTVSDLCDQGSVRSSLRVTLSLLLRELPGVAKGTGKAKGEEIKMYKGTQTHTSGKREVI